jgi:hypothetical protein
MRTATLRRVAALALLPAATLVAPSNAHRARAESAAPSHAAVPDFAGVVHFAPATTRTAFSF